MTIVAPDLAEVQASYTCPPTNDVTATLRGLTMDHHTPPFVLLSFNPWVRQVRADSEAANAWADGGWSGNEWLESVTVPITLLVKTTGSLPGTPYWLELHQQLAEAFAPSHVDIPLTFIVGSDTYVLYGRPRLVEPLAETAFRGWAIARAAFRALDPLIYSSTTHEIILGLPSESGGLEVPFVVPFIIGATVTSGTTTITNAGTAPAGLTLRIDGPVQEPRVSLRAPDGSVKVLRYLDDLASGEYLTIRTRERTAYLQDAVSRRGRITGDWFLLEPGTSEITFGAAVYDASARLTVSWQDAYLS